MELETRDDGGVTIIAVRGDLVIGDAETTFKKTVTRLIEEGRRTFDQEKRKRCYWRIQEILAQEQPYTFLFVPDALPVVNARFRGIEPAPAGIMHNVIRWYVPKEEQVH